MRRRARVSAAVMAALSLLPTLPARGGLREDLLELTGGRRVKIVWQTDTSTDGDHVSGGAEVFRLRGYDTEADAIVDLRAVLDDYSKPMLTRDGERVVYSDRTEKTVYVIDWSGENRRPLVAGSHGALWSDPATGEEWVYYQAGEDGFDHEAPLRRRSLSDPSRDELVWNRTPTQTEYLAVSTDGRQIGGCFPYPRCGVVSPSYEGTGGGGVLYSHGDPAYFSDGCWATITPDPARRVAVFRGNHREWAVWDRPARAGAGPDRIVDIAGAPGVDGQEVYQPRLSRDARFFTLSGPYVGGVARGRAARHRTEIYLGRLDRGFTRVTRWVRVTRNDRADYYPHAWVAAPVEAEPPPPAPGEEE